MICYCFSSSALPSNGSDGGSKSGASVDIDGSKSRVADECSWRRCRPRVVLEHRYIMSLTFLTSADSVGKVAQSGLKVR